MLVLERKGDKKYMNFKFIYLQRDTILTSYDCCYLKLKIYIHILEGGMHVCSR
jgi:hypothetical protein